MAAENHSLDNLTGSRERTSQLALALIASVASAVLTYFGTGLRPIWWVTWLAPIPVLFAAQQIGALSSFLIAFASSLCGALNLWHYAHATMGIPALPIVLILSCPAGIFGLGVLLFRHFAMRGKLLRAALALPVVWVGWEFVSEMTSVNSTFGNLGYTQMNFLPVLQIVSLTGLWGISFCLVLFGTAVALFLGKRGTTAARNHVAMGSAAFLVLVFGYGAWRLGSVRPWSVDTPGNTIDVALLSTGNRDVYPHDDASALELSRAYAAQVPPLVAQGAQIVVIPEKIAIVSDAGARDVDAVFESTATQVHAFILVGVDRGTRTQRSNEAHLYSPAGTLAAVYVKHHLVPGFESVDKPGTARVTAKSPGGVWAGSETMGLEICKDMDFPKLSRDYGLDGVGLMLVPAWDFIVDDWLHGRMAIMRGVESGFSIARAAKQGDLTITDDRGRVVAERDGGGRDFVSVVGFARVLHDDTLYLHWGNWFAWADLAVLAALLLSLFLS